MILQGEEEGEREKHQCKKHRSVASHMCLDQGWNLQPFFGVQDNTPTHLTTQPEQFLEIFYAFNEMNSE